MAGTTNWSFFPCHVTVSIRQMRNRYGVFGRWLYNRMRARQTLNMTTHCVLSPNDYRRMPWKNGLGHTMQIATHPADADLASFVWRVSVAEVTQDGPFSPFAGVDRTLVLLTGAGMKLEG